MWIRSWHVLFQTFRAIKRSAQYCNVRPRTSGMPSTRSVLILNGLGHTRNPTPQGFPQPGRGCRGPRQTRKGLASSAPCLTGTFVGNRGSPLSHTRPIHRTKMVTSSPLPNIIPEGVTPLKYRYRVVVPAALLLALVATVGCKKKTPPPPPQTAPPVAAPAPTAQITASPAAINAGDQVTLTWKTTDATSVSIDGIGDVPTSGVKTVTPSDLDQLSPCRARRRWNCGCDRSRNGECSSAGPAAHKHDVGGRRVPGQHAGHLLRLRRL